MMNLIDEQDRLLPRCTETIRGRRKHAAHFGDVTFHAADPNKFRACHLGDDARQCGLAAAGWPVKSPRADDQLRSPDVKECLAEERVPGRQIPRATLAASASRAAQRCPQFQSPALPRIGPAREKLRRATDASNRASATSKEFPDHERISEDWAEQLRARGIKLFRQDETGAVELNFSNQEWSARAYLTGEVFRSVSR